MLPSVNSLQPEFGISGSVTPEGGRGALMLRIKVKSRRVNGGGGEGYLPIPTSASGPAPLHVNEAVVTRMRGEREGRGGDRGRDGWISGQ